MQTTRRGFLGSIAALAAAIVATIQSKPSNPHTLSVKWRGLPEVHNEWPTVAAAQEREKYLWAKYGRPTDQMPYGSLEWTKVSGPRLWSLTTWRG